MFQFLRLPQGEVRPALRGDLRGGDRVDLALLLHDGLDDHRDRLHPGHPRHRHGADLHRGWRVRARRTLRDRRRQRG